MRIMKLIVLSLSLVVFAGCNSSAGANTKDKDMKQLEQEKEDLQNQVNELQSKNKELNEKFNSFTEEYEKQRNAAYNNELYQFNTKSQAIFQAITKGDVATIQEQAADNIDVSSDQLTITNPEGEQVQFPMSNFQSSSFNSENIFVLKQFSHSEDYDQFNMTYAVRSTKENPNGDYYLYLTYNKSPQSNWLLSNIVANP